MSSYEGNVGPQINRGPYATLGSLSAPAAMALVRATSVGGVLLVPSYGGVSNGYQSLVIQGNTSSSGYASIKAAYGGAASGSCSFTQRQC